MNNIINKDTVGQDNNDPLYQRVLAMSDNDRNKLKQLAMQGIDSQKQTKLVRSGELLQGLGDAFLGKKPEKGTSDINNLIMKQIVEDYFKSQSPEGMVARQRAMRELAQGGTTEELDKQKSQTQSAMFTPAMAYTQGAISRGAVPEKLIPKLSSRYSTTEQRKSIEDLTKSIPKLKESYSQKAMATNIADAVETGMQPPDLKGLFRYQVPIRNALAKKGVNLSQLTQEWLATTTGIKSMNGPQQTRMRTAINSVTRGIPALKEVSDEFKRYDFTPSNWAKLRTNLHGIGSAGRLTLDENGTKGMNEGTIALAARYVTQLNLLRDEVAQVFSGGYAPTEESFRLADDILNPVYGSTALDSALTQLQRNLNWRNLALSDIGPIMPGGQVSRYGGGGTPMDTAQPLSQEAVPTGAGQSQNNDPLGLR